MKLVIVESPTKARKLSGYLGNDYQVEASVGHIRDLPKSGLAIDIDNNFEPTYEVNADKKKVISILTTAAKKADTIILATDPDREGEAIAWHIQTILSAKKNKDTTSEDTRFVRATFHEITKQAVLDAMAHPLQVNMDLVNAQQARRVVDRLVGYQVSPVLWKKVRRGLSAGRVQSVALRMIVEREREIEAFKAEEYWEIDVALATNSQSQISNSKIFEEGKVIDQLPDGVLIARLTEVAGKKFEPKSAEDVAPLKIFLPDATYSVKDVERKERRRSSVPPFTTSTLQQAAATRLGFNSKQTMTLAQQLYEEGLITYHRTDSVNLSAGSITMARSYIESHFGKQYLPEKPNYFANKSKNAQEAHEAIRVTDTALVADNIVGARITANHMKLYDLIWRRFLASQMNSAIYDQTAITIQATSVGLSSPGSDVSQKDRGSKFGMTCLLRSSGSVLKFDGWMRLFNSSEDVILPAVESNQDLSFVQDNYAQKFTQPPARYNDASLVKELEKRGIGRPSTYASIISVIIDRGYVERNQKRFFATAVGMTVSDFLLEHFPMFMEYEFTAEMEENLDRIARGEKEWHGVVKEFYGPFSAKLATVTDTAERVQIPVEKTGETCPTCGQGEVVIRAGRFGKFKSCSRFPECKYTENIVDTVEGVVCPLCQQGEVVAKNSRWGKPFFGCKRYPDCGWASWKKPEPGEVMTQEQWAIQQAERQKRKEARDLKYGTKDTGKDTKTKAKTTKKTTTKKKTVKKATKAKSKKA